MTDDEFERLKIARRHLAEAVFSLDNIINHEAFIKAGESSEGAK